MQTIAVVGDSCIFIAVGEEGIIIEIGDVEFNVSDTFNCVMGETITVGIEGETTDMRDSIGSSVDVWSGLVELSFFSLLRLLD